MYFVFHDFSSCEHIMPTLLFPWLPSSQKLICLLQVENKYWLISEDVISLNISFFTHVWKIGMIIQDDEASKFHYKMEQPEDLGACCWQLIHSCQTEIMVPYTSVSF